MPLSSPRAVGSNKKSFTTGWERMTRFSRESFPDLQAEIRDVYLRNPEFRGLCHDVSICLEEIEWLKESAALEDTNQRIEQFRELVRELEVEIVEHLNSVLTKPTH